MAKAVSAADVAAALLASAGERPPADFARRAAACFALAGETIPGFDPQMVWPGRHSDLPRRHSDNSAIAAALLAAA